MDEDFGTLAGKLGMTEEEWDAMMETANTMTPEELAARIMALPEAIQRVIWEIVEQMPRESDKPPTQ